MQKYFVVSLTTVAFAACATPTTRPAGNATSVNGASDSLLASSESSSNSTGGNYNPPRVTGDVKHPATEVRNAPITPAGSSGGAGSSTTTSSLSTSYATTTFSDTDPSRQLIATLAPERDDSKVNERDNADSGK